MNQKILTTSVTHFFYYYVEITNINQDINTQYNKTEGYNP